MRKFSFHILFLTLLMALSIVNLFAQYSDFDPSAADIGPKHITPMRTHGKFEEDLNPIAPGQIKKGYALTSGGTGASSPISYHGGPVMNTPAIYIIFYGNWNNATGSDTPAGRQIILDWAAGIGTSSRYSLNDSYDTSGNNVSGNAVFGASTVRTGSYKTRLRDSDILSEVKNAISSGSLGPFNPNGVYFLVTSSDVTANSGFCTQYCGWHTHSNWAGQGDLKFSFVGNAARCINSCAAQTNSPNGNPGVDGAISVLTHELEEAHTDPDLNAWYDSSGAENADKCAWTFGHFQFQSPNGSWANVAFGGRNYLIQRGLLHSGTGDFCMQNATQN